MALVRYVPGPTPDHTYWDETFVDESDPTRYRYHGNWCMFTGGDTLATLVARGAWQRDIDPDLTMDEGL